VGITLLLAFITLMLMFLVLVTVMARLLADLLVGWENTKYIWGVFIILTLCTPILVFLGYQLSKVTWG